MNNNSLLNDLRSSARFMSITACFILTCLITVFYSPTVKAIIDFDNVEVRTVSPNIRLMEEIGVAKSQLQTYLQRYSHVTDNNAVVESFRKMLKDRIKILTNLASDSEEFLNESIESSSLNNDQIELKLYKAQREALTTVLPTVYSKFDQIVKSTSANDTLAKTKQALQFLRNIKVGKEHHTTDNKGMPFGPNSALVKKPSISEQELAVKLELPTSNKYSARNTVIFGATNSVIQDEDYLTHSIDTQPSLELESHALALDHDPFKIYQYVHDNVEFVPAQGSIQGASYTFETLRGGSADQASLLISLLRLSAIEARYIFGTVDIDIAAAMNWVGGAQTPAAAQNIMSQGGISSVLISDGKDITHIRIEHFWVEANIGGDWVSLDPSFKQYSYEAKQNIFTSIDFDETAFENELQSNITTGDRYLQGFTLDTVSSQTDLLRDDIYNQLTQDADSLTFGDIFGSKSILPMSSDTLPTTLPYSEVVTSTSFNAIPDSQRHKFAFNVTTDSNESIFTFEQSLPELAGKTIAISFEPSTEADELTLEQYVNDTVLLADSDIIPFGLINVKGQIVIDGEVVLESNISTPLGEELANTVGLSDPRFGYINSTSPLIAGEYKAIGLDFHGVSSAMLKRLFDVNKVTEGKMIEQTFEGLGSHDITGTMLQIGIYKYFALTKGMADLSALNSDILNYRMPSYGTFGTTLSVGYFLGVPDTIKTTGIGIDVDRLADNTEAKNNCWHEWVDFNRQIGAVNSYLESYVPEQFNTSNPEAEGISTAKILALAASQGQKIYTITNTNLDDLNNIIVGDGGMNEIEEALSNNLEVMIHEEPITAFGWQGSGYMIIDPDSGAGAYKISGGANGGFIDFDHASYIWILGLVASFAAPLVSVLAAKILVISAVLATALLVADAVVNYSRLPAEATSSGTAALLAVGLIVTVVAVFNVGVVAALGMLLMSILLVNMVLELLNDIAETLPAIKN